MRSLREIVVVLATVALVGAAGHGLALASAELDGWEGLVAIVLGALAVFVALVSSALAALVVRRRPWRLGLLAVTVAGGGWLLLSSLGADDLLAGLALALTLVLALWLPVGARWWLDSLESEPFVPAAVSRREAILAGVLCGLVVILALGLTLALSGTAPPLGLGVLALVLLVVAAAASGRVHDVVAIVLLLGAGLAAVLFDLPNRENGRLVLGCLAVAVLVTFSWRPLAARLTEARRAARTEVAVPEVPARAQEPEENAPEEGD